MFRVFKATTPKACGQGFNFSTIRLLNFDFFLASAEVCTLISALQYVRNLL